MDAGQIVFSRMFSTEGVSEESGALRHSILNGMLRRDLFLLVLSANERNSLEIVQGVPSEKSIGGKGATLFIVGAADSKKNAFGLVKRITDQCVRATGGADLRKYILDAEQKEQ